MELIRGLHNLRAGHKACVATIGNFDGVHLGHQAVLAELNRQAAVLGVPSLAIIFEPQPAEYFAPREAPARLTRLREKLAAIAAQGVARVLLLHFDHRLAVMAPESFVEDLLIERLGVKLLYVGDDFRFGRDRRGDHALLERYQARGHFELRSLPTRLLDGERISSTRIREALARGDLGLTERLLGRPYHVCGHVAHGFQRGRTIGFPTANIALRRRRSPVHGVFAVHVGGLGNAPLAGVANVGNRPTVDGGDAFWLEVHLFDFDEQIYGRHVDVRFVRKLREERKFESFEALKQQIRKDAAMAREILL
ncbi:MAG TPA: bifunctional riboflavin kinase/FAD synthetase [Chromatiaceae bacterium]|nr:bifunctional riboflavin kinase/FAD synthetase [Chromatiaceae bacterium]